MQTSDVQDFTFQSLHRPLLYRAVNTIGTYLIKQGIPIANFDIDSLKQDAQRKTALSDFGNNSFYEPFEVLVECLNREAKLNAVGQYMMRKLLVDLLIERLRIQDFTQRSPKSLDEKIEKPLFIIGLPRSGTTFLFNLLCQDHHSFWIKHWELCLPPQHLYGDHLSQAEKNRLIQTCRQDLRLFKFLVPHIEKVHPVDITGPEECTYLLHREFMSPLFAVYANIPTYLQWFESTWLNNKQAFIALYQYYRQQIQILQYRQNNMYLRKHKHHWVLKSPVHIISLEAIQTVFPDACFVNIHRDPLKTVPSNCSLIAMMRGIFSENVFLEDIGHQWLDWLSMAVKNVRTIRQENPSMNIIDIEYDQLINNPVATIREIYQRFDYAFPQTMEETLKRYILEHPKGKHGRHVYSPEQFGLSIDKIRQSFGTT
jgi:hypothetical protein